MATRQPLRALRRSTCLGREHVALAESLGRTEECAEPLARSLPEAIARREILETERREASLRACAASQAPSDFRATMSLAIPTPINRILRLLRLVRDTPLSPTQREQIDPAVRSANTRLDLLNDLLAFCKIEAVGWGLNASPSPPRHTAHRRRPGASPHHGPLPPPVRRVRPHPAPRLILFVPTHPSSLTS